MAETQSFVLHGAPGDAPLHGLVQTATQPGPRPTVLVVHGFKGFMEWGFFPPLADLLASRGMTVVRFNVSGSGMGPGDELVTSPEAFRGNTFTQERQEILRVLAALGDEVANGLVDPERIALLGHSRGGGGALLAAASSPWTERLRALVTWNTLADFDRYDEPTKQQWRERGELPVANARTGQELALGLNLLHDLEQHREELSLRLAAGRRRAPWLIVHGEADETVPVGDAHRLAEAATEPHELCLVPGGHTFGARHPFAGPTPELIQAMNATQTWLRRHLA